MTEAEVIKALRVEHTALCQEVLKLMEENGRLKSAIRWACGYDEGGPDFSDFISKENPTAGARSCSAVPSLLARTAPYPIQAPMRGRGRMTDETASRIRLSIITFLAGFVCGQIFVNILERLR